MRDMNYYTMGKRARRYHKEMHGRPEAVLDQTL